MNELTNPLDFRGLSIPLTLTQACDPKHVALLVYDTQVGVIKQIKNNEHIVNGILQVLNAARKAGIRIYFSRHLSLPKELMGVSQLRMGLEWQKVDTVEKISPWFLRGAPAFEIIPELNPLPNEAIFDKITMSAFEGTFLNIALRDSGIKTFIIIGAAMEVGIEPTIRHGSDLGYIPVLVTDACGAGNEQAAQRSVDSISFAGFGFQTDIETICSIIQSNSVA
jgi:biuret amidohydrolase